MANPEAPRTPEEPDEAAGVGVPEEPSKPEDFYDKAVAVCKAPEHALKAVENSLPPPPAILEADTQSPAPQNERAGAIVETRETQNERAARIQQRLLERGEITQEQLLLVAEYASFALKDSPYKNKNPDELLKDANFMKALVNNIKTLQKSLGFSDSDEDRTAKRVPDGIAGKVTWEAFVKMVKNDGKPEDDLKNKILAAAKNTEEKTDGKAPEVAAAAPEEAPAAKAAPAEAAPEIAPVTPATLKDLPNLYSQYNTSGFTGVRPSEPGKYEAGQDDWEAIKRGQILEMDDTVAGIEQGTQVRVVSDNERWNDGKRALLVETPKGRRATVPMNSVDKGDPEEFAKAELNFKQARFDELLKQDRADLLNRVVRIEKDLTLRTSDRKTVTLEKGKTYSLQPNPQNPSLIRVVLIESGGRKLLEDVSVYLQGGPRTLSYLKDHIRDAVYETSPAIAVLKTEAMAQRIGKLSGAVIDSFYLKQGEEIAVLGKKGPPGNEQALVRAADGTEGFIPALAIDADSMIAREDLNEKFGGDYKKALAALRAVNSPSA